MKVVTAKQAWSILANEQNSILVDVRTPQEWAEVGLPDASNMIQPVETITWYQGLEKEFLDQLLKVVPDQSQEIFFLCRSGVRSHHAALLAEHAGYVNVTNIIDGFEDKHGPGSGWRASGLPMTYKPLSGS